MENFPFVMPPLAHQLEEFEISKDLPRRGLFWEMGTGKSKVEVDTMAHLWMTGKIDVVIIMAKKGEYSNWKYTELPAHMPEQVPYVCELYRSAMRKAEKEAIKELVKPSDKLRIFCVNVESMAFDGGKCARAISKSARKGVMAILDESTCCKTVKAARYKHVKDIFDKAKYRRILTGTPITRGPLDLWGQCNLLGPGVLGHTSFFSFKGYFALEETVYLGTKHFKQVVGYHNLDRLNKQIKTFASIKERSECVDLPDKIYSKVVVPLTDRQQDMYDTMRDEALAIFKDGEILEATNALSIITRLDQIACGQLRKEDGTFEIIENNRVPALMERIDISGKKGIIWCNYRGLLQHIHHEISREFGPELVGQYFGGVPDAEREDTVRRFQDPDDPLRWIVANQQSMGYGRTLTRGKENYYYSNGYNLEHRLQSEDRTMRIGQDEAVSYTDFYSPETTNERVLYLLRAKRNLASEVLGTNLRDWI